MNEQAGGFEVSGGCGSSVRTDIGGCVQADEIPVKVLDPERGGKAARSYLRTYHVPSEKIVFIDFNLRDEEYLQFKVLTSMLPQI